MTEKSEPSPLIAGLINALPAPGSDWPVAEQVKWLRAAASIFDLLFTFTGASGAVTIIESAATDSGQPQLKEAGAGAAPDPTLPAVTPSQRSAFRAALVGPPLLPLRTRLGVPLVVWTKDDDARLRAMSNQRVPIKKIAETLGRTLASCKARRRQLGLKNRRRDAQPRGPASAAST